MLRYFPKYNLKDCRKMFTSQNNSVCRTKSDRQIQAIASSFRSLKTDEHEPGGSSTCLAGVQYYSNILRKISPLKKFPITRLAGYRGQAPYDVQILARNEIELKQFLGRFSTVFEIIDGMFVMLKDSTKNSIHQKCSKTQSSSYNNAAVEFYTKILKAKAPKIGMSIIQLVGHRGQAPLNVQLHAKNDKELSLLLKAFPSIFTVMPDGWVFLNSEENVTDSSLENVNSNEISYDSNPAVEYYYKILNRVSPDGIYPILRLIGYRGQATLEVQKAARNEHELMEFLRQYPNVFTVHDNCNVSLNKTKRTECNRHNIFDRIPSNKSDSDVNAVIGYFQSILGKPGADFGLSVDELSSSIKFAPPAVKSLVGNSNELCLFLSKHPDVFTVESNRAFLTATYHRNEKAFEILYNILSQAKDKMLPLKILLKRFNYNTPIRVKMIAPNESQLISLLSCYPSIFRIWNDHVYLIDYLNKQTMDGMKFPPITCSFKKPIHQNWEDYVLNNTEVIEDLSECISVCNMIMEQSVIAVDCEGYNLGRGKISIIQIALANGKIFIFDMLEEPDMIRKGGLKQILTSEKIVKVMHSCRNDSMNLILEYGVGLRNVFDTSVAYNVIINGLFTMSNFKTIGINEVCSSFGAPQNDWKEKVRDLYRMRPAFWLSRPLTQEMIAYSALDVASLIPYIYSEFVKRLDEKTDLVIWLLSQKLCKL